MLQKTMDGRREPNEKLSLTYELRAYILKSSLPQFSSKGHSWIHNKGVFQINSELEKTLY